MSDVKVTETPEVETVEVQETKQPNKNEMLRELSKEYGVNLFDAEGIKQFKEYTENQKTEQQKLQEELDAYKTKEADWSQKKLEYETKLKATELGIKPDYLGDVLRLADNNPDNIIEVVKKYPMFKSKEGVRIGVQSPEGSTPPDSNSEVEAYMASNPKYKNYRKK